MFIRFNMKKIAYILLLLCASEIAYTQELLINEDVIVDSTDRKYGQNGTLFYYSFIKYGFVVGANDQDKNSLLYGKSGLFSFGGRLKRKMSAHSDILLSVAYQNTFFHFKQDTLKSFPSIGIHEKEKMNIHDLLLELNYRLNFGKRGNVIRNYIDIGIFGAFTTSATHTYLEKNAQANAKYTEIKNYKLSYIYPLNYGLIARVGHKNISVYGSYRWNSYFKDAYAIPELSKYSIGIELGLY